MSIAAADQGPAVLDGRTTIEGVARVVALDGGFAVMEPEQTTMCGGCHSSATCGAKPGTSRLVARRFRMENVEGLTVDDRVVVGISEQALLGASLTAYLLPLVTMFAFGLTAQALFDGDAAAAVGALLGLGFGLLLARWRAKLLSSRGQLAPRFLRRATGSGPGAECSVE
jgi:sigma-E factor negative regulatory protein RseC